MTLLRLAILLAAVALAGCVGNPRSPTGAEAVTTGDVNMRAGPGTRFPSVAVIPAGSVVRVYGCLENRQWCDTSFGSARGWVSSRFLDTFYVNNIYVPYRPLYAYPIVAFDFGYWDTWYGGYPWYYRDYGYYPRWGYRGGGGRNDDLVIRPGGGGGGGGGGRRND
jgi:uncharacterized protein YraI